MQWWLLVFTSKLKLFEFVPQYLNNSVCVCNFFKDGKTIAQIPLSAPRVRKTSACWDYVLELSLTPCPAPGDPDHIRWGHCSGRLSLFLPVSLSGPSVPSLSPPSLQEPSVPGPAKGVCIHLLRRKLPLQDAARPTPPCCISFPSLCVVCPETVQLHYLIREFNYPQSQCVKAHII